MSNNNSILFVGIAAAVLLCGATAGIAIACMNSDTTMTDEQLYLKGYADGCASAENGEKMLLKVLMNDDEPMAPYEFGFMTGYNQTEMAKDINMMDMARVGADPSTYEYYLEYLDWFNNVHSQTVSTLQGVSVAKLEREQIKDANGYVAMS